MKKLRKISTIVVLMLVVFMLSGCFGNFALTRRVYKMNQSVGSKWANTAVMWVFMILPVYQACGFLDVVVLNTIEFWSGENPLAMAENEVDIQKVASEDNTYEIKASKNRYDITVIAGKDKGKNIAVVYDPVVNSWKLQADGKISTLAQIEGSRLELIYPDGSVYETDLTLD
jgi:uncharacterized lipoprotein YehR (DUF1307 family)